MTDPQPPKDGDSFFRKVVRFVANPATDWADLNSRQDDGRDLDLEKSELKAMIERKKRNDFVRKREFDMLRKVRREGLSPEQLAALGGSSRLDDSESRAGDNGARSAEGGVKAKIDEIEQQMVGDNFASSSSRKPVGMFEEQTQKMAVPPDHDPCRRGCGLAGKHDAPPAASRAAARQRPAGDAPRATRRRRCRWAACRVPPPATSPARSRSRSARSCTTPNSTRR